MLSKIKKNEKGFTLMEMLIVVAIIAVLVAIAIPTFTSSLNKAKVATDQANIRAGYASAMLKVLESDLDGATTPITAGTKFWLNADGSVTQGDTAPTSGAYTCKIASPANATVAGQTVTWTKDGNVFYTYTTDGQPVTPTPPQPMYPYITCTTEAEGLRLLWCRHQKGSPPCSTSPPAA